jgi:hypothetical protein
LGSGEKQDQRLLLSCAVGSVAVGPTSAQWGPAPVTFHIFSENQTHAPHILAVYEF